MPGSRMPTAVLSRVRASRSCSREGVMRRTAIGAVVGAREARARSELAEPERGSTMATAMPVPMGATGGWRAKVQRFGGFLAGMVIPNIGAFLAWGLITTFFIPTGWIPNEDLAQLVGPMIFFLLPVLIGYTGGHLVHGQRGAVVGAIATMGVAIGGFVGTEV